MDVQIQQGDAPAAPSNHSLSYRRRTSLPASLRTSETRPKKRSANVVRTQAASPQIISSLIDQLSAISIPAHDHFENLLVGYNDALSASAPAPATPTIQTSSGRNSLSGRNGSFGDQSAYYNSMREQNDAYPDDACEPPVIRTSKPPSGLSPLTAPKKREKSHPLGSYIGRGSSSSASIHSTHSAQSATSFGNISIEPGIHRQPSTGSDRRSSAESKRSTKAHRSLMYMSSRERLRQRETERKRHTTSHTFEETTSNDSPRKGAAALFPYEDTIKEEPTVKEPTIEEESIIQEEPTFEEEFTLEEPAIKGPIIREEAPSEDEDKPFAVEVSRFTQRYPERKGSLPRRLRINLVDSPVEDSSTEKGLIPERGSSLKHTGSPPRKTKKNRQGQARNSQQEQVKTDASPEKQEKQGKASERAAMKEEILKELEQEENEVAQRIRELKEQKLRRDILAGKLPMDVDAGLTPPEVAHVSATPTTELALTATVSGASEPPIQTANKAHRVLGIPPESRPTAQPAADELATNSESQALVPEFGARPQTRLLRHSRNRSLTVNDGDDFTPLPINYALALKQIEDISPPSPTLSAPRAPGAPSSSVSIASTKEPKTAANPPQRANSVATTSSTVGGPSTMSRQTTTSTLMNATSMNATSEHKHSSSVTDGALSSKEPSLRSVSEETGMRHRSMIMSSPASNSLQLQRRRTFSKKRWSHPDLPAKAEKAHNAKVDKAEAAAATYAPGAVQRIPHPVIEERPTSLDSIDMEVNSFLKAPRLSQKIRHPQTGRIISFSEVGDPNGFAVFVCVGMGLTRFVMAFYDQLAATLKLRLITPERPGIGGSQVDPNGTPLSWPDDVLVLCQALKITKFSLLAHSAGAIYALATSLRMPQHIRGRVHLLAPWIPPSQMAPVGITQDSPPTQQLPRSQRFLRALPPSLLKVANSTFLSGTSASLQRSGPKNSPKSRRRSIHLQPDSTSASRPSLKDERRESLMLMDQVLPNASSLTLSATTSIDQEQHQRIQEALTLAERERQRAFDERLTFAIWDRATSNANPATDLIVCLETKQTIGFRYEDINRPVVIHHGSKDTRVPVDNVRWLGKLMRKCEVRILEGEQHGLMASAQVMGNVLTEMASDWEDWTAVVQGKADHRSLSRKRTADRLRNAFSKDDLR